MVGDTDHYLSPYVHGVAAASGRLGLLHSQISIRQPFQLILERVMDVRPHVLWTHMLLWPPLGSPGPSELLHLCFLARRQFGTAVIIHDGDLKSATRWPHDISDSVDLALLNHHHDRSAWKVPTLYWPYACFPQDRIAPSVFEMQCSLAFAGQIAAPGAGGIYDARSNFLRLVQARVPGFRLFGGGQDNTLLRTADLAASAGAVLGFGRPNSGWIDNRVFQYPGAGGILLHDDVPTSAGMEPWDGTHGQYVPYPTGDVQAVKEIMVEIQGLPARSRQSLRDQAFQHGQEHHSYTARVQQVLDFLGLRR